MGPLFTSHIPARTVTLHQLAVAHVAALALSPAAQCDCAIGRVFATQMFGRVSGTIHLPSGDLRKEAGFRGAAVGLNDWASRFPVRELDGLGSPWLSRLQTSRLRPLARNPVLLSEQCDKNQESGRFQNVRVQNLELDAQPRNLHLL